MSQTIDIFNNILLDLIRNIAYVCPRSIVGSNIKIIENIINEPSNKNKFIGIFIESVLQYKDQIDNGDEDFFIKKTYNNDLKGNNYMINNIFQFKDIWNFLEQENKNIIIEYMQILCSMAQKHFVKHYC